MNIKTKSFWLLLCLTSLVLISCQKEVTVEQLLSADPDIRSKSVKIYSESRESRKLKLVAPLIIALRDPNSDVVQRATSALKIAGPNAANQVKATLDDKDPFVRAAGIEIIANYAKSDPSLRPLIEKMAKDPHPFVHDEATFALKQLKTT